MAEAKAIARDQLRSIDRARLRGRLARLSDEDLRQVGQALAITLGLP